MPETGEQPDHDCRGCRPDAVRESRQREAAPAEFFPGVRGDRERQRHENRTRIAGRKLGKRDARKQVLCEPGHDDEGHRERQREERREHEISARCEPSTQAGRALPLGQPAPHDAGREGR